MTPDLETALLAVRAAARACRAVLASTDLGVLQKDDRSPVTVADFASQAAAAGVLADRAPQDALVAEEGSEALREPAHRHLLDRVAAASGVEPERALERIDRGAGEPQGRFWTLDPIDGTKGFLRGDQYAIALGLVEDGRVVAGALGCPRLDGGTVLWAARGTGAFAARLGSPGDGARLRVAACSEPADLVVCESVEPGHSRHDVGAELEEALGITAAPARVDSQAKYALVARGDAHAYWRLPTRPGYREKIWDHAAGVVLVEEAGGRVTDIDGRPLDFSQGKTLASNRGVVATAGTFHQAILEAIAPHFAGP